LGNRDDDRSRDDDLHRRGGAVLDGHMQQPVRDLEPVTVPKLRCCVQWWLRDQSARYYPEKAAMAPAGPEPNACHRQCHQPEGQRVRWVLTCRDVESRRYRHRGQCPDRQGQPDALPD
jgi:hypothetical protein